MAHPTQDIDDLESTDKLEDYVQKSGTMLVLLGRKTREHSYFTSMNCLRELRAAQKYHVPIVAMRDMSLDRGRDTLAELKAFCPEDLRDIVFPANNAVLTWHRVKAFQQLSLAQLGEQILLASPAYRQARELPLSVPHALAWNHPLFDAPFALYVSAYNEEAKDVADEVRSIDAANTRESRSQLVLASGGPAVSGPGRWARMEHERKWGWLLVLSAATFDSADGETLLADELHASLLQGIQPVVVYDADGSEFGDIIRATPQRLKDAGLYKPLAIEWHAGAHRCVSVRLILKAFGATHDAGGPCGKAVRNQVVAISDRLFDRMSSFRDSVPSLRRNTKQQSIREHLGSLDERVGTELLSSDSGRLRGSRRNGSSDAPLPQGSGRQGSRRLEQFTGPNVKDFVASEI